MSSRRPGAALAPAALAILALVVLTGCETTAEKSARLARLAKPAQVAQKGLSITRESRTIRVLSTAAVRGSQGTAAVVTLVNTSAQAQRHVPIAISVEDTHGKAVYANDVPGLAASLTSIALIPAHSQISWVDDQIEAKGTRVRAKVGEGSALAAPTASLVVRKARLADDPGGGTDAEGTVVNPSATDQGELVIYAVARRGGHIVAAGRAALETLAARSSAPFQLFFVGDPRNAQLQFSAPATTPG